MFETITDNKWLVGGLAVTSIFLFVVTLLVLPLIIIRLPVDYFQDIERHRKPWKYPVFGIFMLGLKNLAGLIFLVAGVIMLVTPGQGVLSILIGLTMMNYPGKYRFERWLVSRRHVWRAIGWIRQRANVHPLEEFGDKTYS